ncbi:allantoinase AllB [Metabacillus rhizolycopersici]|uniref:Allantoinase n=1 Tax=Metabacillus rhizolycopersici TaxID=2875709 RepID=A0ABS7V052_9BACI|nr:allantoinase AllB [Metabacillus rhizolycopersici]MBZ5753672.1 allantoinase AllB [Metabacillus rhizolycopersici]
MKFDLVVKNGNVVLENSVEKLDIGILNGKIVEISNEIAEESIEVIDASHQYVMPGMIDAHVHICEPGRTEWEGFVTGTQALAAGGTTSFIDMPLNALPATTTKDALQLKLKSAENKAYVDYALYGGLVPDNLEDLEDLSNQGVVAFKCFMATCGSDEIGDFKNVNDYTLYQGMKKLAELGHVLSIHAENAELTDKLAMEKKAQGKTTARDYVESRPIFTEVDAVKRALLLGKETGCQLHFVHISSAEAVEEILKARKEGQVVTIESCPHYFTLDTEDFERIGPVAKCAPPLRAKTEQEKLWAALQDGKIDILTSDHSPCPPDMKQSDTNNMFEMWGGISGCQNNVDLMFDEAVKKRGVSVSEFSKMIATKPAEIFNLATKGRMKVSYDADIILLDPNKSYTVQAEDLYYRHQHSPYVGRDVNCRVTKTFVRGQLVYDMEKGIVSEPIGKYLTGQNTLIEA